jgi:ABC-2 type transport system permease protein
MSFSGILCLGYFHLAVMGALVGLTIALATEPASEIENGFMDMILSRSLRRHWVITRSGVLVLLCSAFLLSMMMLGSWAGLYTLAPADATWPSPRLVGSLALNLGVLMFCWSGITLAISSFCRRRSVAGSLAGVLALTTYLLDYLARAWEPAESVAWVSPFRYYNPLEMVMGRSMPAYHLWVLVGTGAVAYVVAYVAFSRRDI